jgi:hypothetical protein
VAKKKATAGWVDKWSGAAKVEPRMLYLSYQETRSGGEICEGQENDPWPSHEDEDIEFYPTRINKTTDKAQWMKESIPIDFDALEGQDVWVVVVRYGTGGTFGHTNGAWQVMGAFEHQGQAEKLRTSINDDTYVAENNYGCGYICWKGYFESLQDVEVHKMTVQA